MNPTTMNPCTSKILFVHGLDSNRESTKFHAIDANQKFCIEIDYRNLNFQTVANFYRDIIAKIQPEILVGHSLGAYWALKMSVLHKIPAIIANPSLSPNFREDYPPIDEDDLEVAISKFKMRLPKPENSLQLDFEQIKKMFQNPFDKNFKTRFTVKIGQHLKVVSVDEIECFFSENKGTYIHTFDNRNYLIESTLEVLEQELDPKQFYRISRKFIVPLKAVKEIQVYSNSRLKIILPT